ncbi:MAG: hypothetical protein WBX11_04130 [Thiobacillaceae bacterium]
MNNRWRKLSLYGALAATLAAVWWSLRLPQDEEAMVENIERAKPVAHSKKTSPSVAKDQKNRPRLSAARLDAFAARDWTPPPPPKLAALPPPPPMAPPLPYRYLGKLQDQGHLIVFLDSNSLRPILVKGGEVLDGQWRVEEITPRLMRFTYLPLAQTATLSIGDTL